VDKASSLLPHDVALRVKGRTAARAGAGTAAPGAVGDGEGFILG